ncbi:MAG: FtsX-like permease family protein [Marinifilaceae bacterium]|jgi:putative ABC transport system permease protein|nr:FtsX-like permease family protein [Marinifilaceae bacterium]
MLNILGLSIGLTCCILSTLYLYDEFTYDKFNDNYDDIVRLETDLNVNNKKELVPTSSVLSGPILKDESNHVLDFVRILEADDFQVQTNYNSDIETNIAFSESSLFNIFSIKTLYGDPKTALDSIGRVVIDTELALKYFGKHDCIGDSLKINEEDFYIVSAVIEPIPENSSIKFSAFVSINTLNRENTNIIFDRNKTIGFWNFNTYTYLLLDSTKHIEEIRKSFNIIYNKHMAELSDVIGANFNAIFKKLKDIHLNNNNDWEYNTSDKKYLNSLIIIIIIILSIASINYMTIVSSRYSPRTKEVGIRKTIGASKSYLIKQFLFESIAISFIALFFALIISELCLDSFAGMINKKLSLNFIDKPQILLILISITLGLGTISGLYPAYYLSSYNPIDIFRNNLKRRNINANARKLMVIIQVGFASLIVSGTIIITSQLNYLQNKNLGFNDKNIIILKDVDEILMSDYDNIRTKLLQKNYISDITCSSGIQNAIDIKVIHKYESAEGMKETVMPYNMIPPNYISFFELNITDSLRINNLESNIDSSNLFYVNQEAVKRFNWSEPLGKSIQMGIELPEEITNQTGDKHGTIKGKIVGIVNDFHYQNLKFEIEAFCFKLTNDTESMQQFYVKYKPGFKSKSIDELHKIWNKYYPNKTYKPLIMEELWDNQFNTEKSLTKAFIIFSILSVFISIIGLFGLSTFMTQQRTKEIGIRKTLGARLHNLLVRFNIEYFGLLVFANIIAAPFVYIYVNKWLKYYPYHIETSWMIHLVSSFILLIIFSMLLIWQAWYLNKIKISNSLRHE